MNKIREQIFNGFPAPKRVDMHAVAFSKAPGNPVPITLRRCFIFHKDT